jgi:Protein of unknown function (DUF2652)
MESGPALLLIADIGGYTEYMRSHRMSLAHAEATTARLLGKVIDAARGFDLIEIEGDAAFLCRRAGASDGDAVAATTRAAVSMHRAFHIERQHVVTNMCPCESCAQADNLKLKFVAHIGEVATQNIKKQRTKLVGIDVIFVHRLLKNPVQVPEYVLLSEELYRTGDASLVDSAHEVSQDLEGIGPVRAYFVDVEDLAGPLPPLPDPSWLGRLGRTVGLAGRGLPYMLGLRRGRLAASA